MNSTDAAIDTDTNTVTDDGADATQLGNEDMAEARNAATSGGAVLDVYNEHDKDDESDGGSLADSDREGKSKDEEEGEKQV